MSKLSPLFRSLCAPFDPAEVKSRPQGNRKLSYITARTAMNRLDNVLGPENWFDEYFPNANAVLCKLTIRLPDGTLLTKMDAGGHASMQDQGDDEKSAFSDAFKRACVKFGIGRYLYGDGVPEFEPGQIPEMNPASTRLPELRPATVLNQTGPPPQRRTNPSNFKIPKTGKGVYAWSMEMGEHFQTSILDHVRQESKKLGYTGRITEMSPEIAHDVCLETIKFISCLPNYKGEYDELIAQENPGIPQEQAEEVKTLRRRIVASLKSLLYYQLGRDPEVHDLRIAFVHYASMDGEAPDSLQNCWDINRLKKVIERITTVQEELAADRPGE